MKFADGSAARLLLILISVDTLLLFAHALVSMIDWFPGSNLFNLDFEQAIGTWWSGNQLLISGVLIGFATISSLAVSPAPRLFLWLLASGFVFLSLDEVVSIHERFTQFRNVYATWMPVFNGGNGAWVFVYALLGLVLVVLTRRDIAYLWIRYRSASVAMSAGFLMLVFGAVVLEIAGNFYGLLDPPELQVGLEEYFEMLGGSVIVYASVLFLQQVYGERPNTA